MIRAIINGDDFGKTQDINEAVRECFERRFITNTTLMVNMPWADDAVEMAKEYGFFEAVGLHLNLTSGYPLTKRIRKEPRFCRKDGSFNAFFQTHTLTRLAISSREAQAVREEAEAQIRKYFSYGLPEKHLDSHHHVHTDRSVIGVLMPLMLKYGFRSVRLTRNLYLKMNPLKRVYKAAFNRKLRGSGLFTTDYFGSFKDLSAMEGKLKTGALIEVMVHPMYDSEEGLSDSGVPFERIKELLDSLNAERQPY